MKYVSVFTRSVLSALAILLSLTATSYAETEVQCRIAGSESPQAVYTFKLFGVDGSEDPNLESVSTVALYTNLTGEFERAFEAKVTRATSSANPLSYSYLLEPTGSFAFQFSGPYPDDVSVFLDAPGGPEDGMAFETCKFLIREGVTAHN